MAIALKRTSEPQSEPFTLDQMKVYLRVDDDSDDDFISVLITAARERVEDLTGRCLMQQQWQLGLDRFPYHRGEILLPRAPLLSLDSITYLDLVGQRVTLSDYTVDELSEPTRIRPARNTTWPQHVTDTNSIVITFTVGYAVVPQSLQQAMRLIAASYYDNRAEVVQGASFASLPPPLSAQSLMSTYELFPVGYPAPEDQRWY